MAISLELPKKFAMNIDQARQAALEVFRPISRKYDLAEHAYQQTRALLRSRRASLTARLGRHGISLNADALDDPRRRLVVPMKPRSRIGQAIVSLQETMEDLGDLVAPKPRRHGAA